MDNNHRRSPPPLWQGWGLARFRYIIPPYDLFLFVWGVMMTGDIHLLACIFLQAASLFHCFRPYHRSTCGMIHVVWYGTHDDEYHQEESWPWQRMIIVRVEFSARTARLTDWLLLLLLLTPPPSVKSIPHGMYDTYLEGLKGGGGSSWYLCMYDILQFFFFFRVARQGGGSNVVTCKIGENLEDLRLYSYYKYLMVGIHTWWWQADRESDTRLYNTQPRFGLFVSSWGVCYFTQSISRVTETTCSVTAGLMVAMRTITYISRQQIHALADRFSRFWPFFWVFGGGFRVFPFSKSISTSFLQKRSVTNDLRSDFA